MATIKAGWRRTVQVRPYETEELTLGVETSWDEVNDGDPVAGAAGVAAQLARQGDQLVAERLAQRQARADEASPSSRPFKPTAPTEPDEYV